MVHILPIFLNHKMLNKVCIAYLINTELLPCARHCSKCFKNIYSLGKKKKNYSVIKIKLLSPLEQLESELLVGAGQPVSRGQLLFLHLGLASPEPHRLRKVPPQLIIPLLHPFQATATSALTKADQNLSLPL